MISIGALCAIPWAVALLCCHAACWKVASLCGIPGGPGGPVIKNMVCVIIFYNACKAPTQFKISIDIPASTFKAIAT